MTKFKNISNKLDNNNNIITNDLSYGNKPPISLVPPLFIIEVAKCMEDGAKKRSPYNWRNGKVSAMQLLDKVLRHTLATVDGLDKTLDSNLDNLASAAADIAVYLDAKEHGALIDDRPFKHSSLKDLQNYFKNKVENEG